MPENFLQVTLRQDAGIDAILNLQVRAVFLACSAQSICSPQGRVASMHLPLSQAGLNLVHRYVGARL